MAINQIKSNHLTHWPGSLVAWQLELSQGQVYYQAKKLLEL